MNKPATNISDDSYRHGVTVTSREYVWGHVNGVDFVTPQVIRPESHQNRAPPGLGDCKSIAFPLVSHSPQITKIMMRKIIYYYGISSLSDAPFFPCPFLKEIALQLRTEHPWDEIIIKTPSYDDVQHFHSPGVRNHLSR